MIRLYVFWKSKTVCLHPQDSSFSHEPRSPESLPPVLLEGHGQLQALACSCAATFQTGMPAESCTLG